MNKEQEVILKLESIIKENEFVQIGFSDQQKDKTEIKFLNTGEVHILIAKSDATIAKVAEIIQKVLDNLDKQQQLFNQSLENQNIYDNLKTSISGPE